MKTRRLCRAQLYATMSLCDKNVCRSEVIKKSNLFNSQLGQRLAVAAQLRKFRVNDRRIPNKATVKSKGDNIQINDSVNIVTRKKIEEECGEETLLFLIHYCTHLHGLVYLLLY